MPVFDADLTQRATSLRDKMPFRLSGLPYAKTRLLRFTQNFHSDLRLMCQTFGTPRARNPSYFNCRVGRNSDSRYEYILVWTDCGYGGSEQVWPQPLSGRYASRRLSQENG